MPKKEDLLERLCQKPAPKNFTLRELNLLLGKCGCSVHSGGRGAGIAYVHEATGRVLAFDAPHPGNELYRYHIAKAIQFLAAIGEIEKGDEKK